MTTTQNPTNTFIFEVISLIIGVTLGGITALLAIALIIFSDVTIGVMPLLHALNGILPIEVYTLLETQLQAMGLPLQGDTPAFWYLSRVSALIGYFFMWLSMIWGLLLSTKLVKSRISPALIFGTHELLALMGMGFALFHAFILLGDSYLKFRLSDILVPFSSSFQTVPIGIGTLSLYLYGLLMVSFYIRKRIGKKVWRALHYTTFLAFIAVTAHGLFVGTDSAFWLVKTMYLSAVTSVLFLVYHRILITGKNSVRRSPRPLQSHN